MARVSRVTRDTLTFASVFLWLVLALPVAAQIPGVPGEKASTAQTTEDPFGRESPRATIMAFTRAVHRDELAVAANYLQLTPSQAASAPSLARGLTALMDRYFSQPVISISGSPEGVVDDGLPLDRERLGPLTVGGRKVYIGLVRVTNPQAGPIWLISSETLAEVPTLNLAIPSTWVERVMPVGFVRRTLFGITLAQWALAAASIAIPLIVLRLLSGMLSAFARRTIDDPHRRAYVDDWYAGLRWPVITVLTVAIHSTAMRFLRFPLSFRLPYIELLLAISVGATAWLIRRLLKLSFERARNLVHGRDHTSTQSLMLLGERALQALVIVVAIVTILSIAGVETKTALAGLGIGGVAIALGAQKTVENALGGVFLLSDRALAVGDTCTIATRKGVVEDITLRSVRLRTEEQTLLSIPAGTLSQSSVENFASRGKILIKTKLRLRYGTSAQQISAILTAIERLIADNPKLETATSHVRLIDFGDRAVELELAAYVLTADGDEFLLVRQDLLLAIATVVESSGSAFAQPTQFLYVDREPAADQPVREPVARDDVRLAQPSLEPVRGRP